MAFPTHIFKAYDIRGLATGELSPEVAYYVGRAFVRYLRSEGVDLIGKKLVVGHDMRPTSLGFQERVIRAIQDEGVMVVAIGLVSTPLFNFACAHYPEHAGGIMVTASHNPAKDNGFKMCFGNALPVPGKALLATVEAVIAEGVTVNQAPADATEQMNPRADYFAKIFSLVPPESIAPLSVVIDFGNGMGSVTFLELLRSLPQVKATFLYPEPDGNFPNHEANPLKTETLRDLQNAVIKECADFGFALDGDADRVGMVDEKGNVVGATYVATLVSQEVLKAHGPGLLLHNPQCGLILGDAWRAAGGTVDFCQTGHANMKKMMLDRGAVFAAEMSLHLYFQDMYNVECGELCFMYLLKRLSDTGEKVSALIAPLETYVHSGEINFETEKKDEAILALEDVYKKDAREISHLDGLWMQLPWGWFNVRKSNTEPVLRLNLETSTKEETERRVNEIQKIIEQL